MLRCWPTAAKVWQTQLIGRKSPIWKKWDTMGMLLLQYKMKVESGTGPNKRPIKTLAVKLPPPCKSCWQLSFREGSRGEMPHRTSRKADKATLQCLTTTKLYTIERGWAVCEAACCSEIWSRHKSCFPWTLCHERAAGTEPWEKAVCWSPRQGSQTSGFSDRSRWADVGLCLPEWPYMSPHGLWFLDKLPINKHILTIYKLLLDKTWRSLQLE